MLLQGGSQFWLHVGNCFFDLLFMAFVIIIIHNSLPQGTNCQHLLDYRNPIPKNIYFCFTGYEVFMWITNCGKFLKRWQYQTTLSASWETCMQVKKQQLEPDMEQWTGSKLGKEYIKAVYCHPAYLTSMQNTSCKMPGWMNSKLDSRLPEEISTLQICR